MTEQTFSVMRPTKLTIRFAETPVVQSQLINWRFRPEPDILGYSVQGPEPDLALLAIMRTAIGV
jgi:hypothetical protein